MRFQALRKITWQQWLALVTLIIVIALAWIFRERLQTYLSSLDQARIWLQNLGAAGPLALIIINALQIVVAPIPGYPVQVAAGWVYGVWPGGLFGVMGLALGAALAITLARLLGRPFVVRIIGQEKLSQWEHVLHADSAWLWALVFLGPVGDIPYFLGGLSSYPISRLVVIAVLVRSPSVLLAAAVGAGLVAVDPQQALAYIRARPYLALLALFVLLLIALALVRFGPRLREQIEQRFHSIFRRKENDVSTP